LALAGLPIGVRLQQKLPFIHKRHVRGSLTAESTKKVKECYVSNSFTIIYNVSPELPPMKKKHFPPFPRPTYPILNCPPFNHLATSLRSSHTRSQMKKFKHGT
jgi:hypothetical protein